MAVVGRRLMALISLRAGCCCEYCGLPQNGSILGFQPDHILALKHGGPTAESNLAWSCFYCNSYKGACIAGHDPVSGRLTRLYHPRTDAWHNHFKWSGARIVGTTPVGRTTVQVLNLNHPDAVHLRRSLIAEGLMVVK